ncbi:MAG: alanine racemase [Arachnia sp.]
MTLILTIDDARWHAHQRSVRDDIAGLVPVAKGNGYGFGLGRLATEARRLDVGSIAVGTAEEVPAVRAGGWNKDVVVLNPWRPGDSAATALLGDPRVITTVSRLADLAELRGSAATARVLVEVETSMHRHGIGAAEISEVDPGPLTFEGWSVHLPASGSRAEAEGLAKAAVRHIGRSVWVSHLSIADYRKFRIHLGVRTRMRVGTRLWLGAPEALHTTATVLDVHPIKRGERFGYHKTKAPANGFLVIVSGGTAQGVALAAPVPQRSLRQRAATITQGLLNASGRSLSPFTVAGRKRPFAEPPHMHASMIFVPGSLPPASVGDEVPVTVRMTTTTFDEVRFS